MAGQGKTGNRILVQAVWDNPELSARHKLVLLALIHYRNNKSGLCCPSVSTLAKIMSLSPRQVLRLLADLETQGLILTIHQYKGRNNAYTIQL